MHATECERPHTARPQLCDKPQRRSWGAARGERSGAWGRGPSSAPRIPAAQRLSCWSRSFLLQSRSPLVFLLVPSKFPAAAELERLCRHTGPWGPAGQWPRGASSSGRWPSPDACALGLGPGAGRVLTYPGTSLWSGELPTHCVVRETGVELVLPSSGGSGKPCPAFGVCLYECHRGAAILAVSSAHTSTPSHTCCSDVRSHLFSPRLHPLWSSCWSRENRDLSGTADSTFGGVLNTTPPAAPTRPRGQVPQ